MFRNRNLSYQILPSLWRFVALSVALLSIGTVFSQTPADPLSYSFDKHYGQVEVGGRYVGAEFHESRPIPSRISFYYPVANSIDLSTDYW
jgi:hypothetical protein